MEKQEFNKRTTSMDLNLFPPPSPSTRKDAIHQSYID